MGDIVIDENSFGELFIGVTVYTIHDPNHYYRKIYFRPPVCAICSSTNSCLPTRVTLYHKEYTQNNNNDFNDDPPLSETESLC